MINKVKSILQSGSPQPTISTTNPNSSTRTTATTKVTASSTATTKVTTATTTSRNSSGKCSRGDGFYALPGCTGLDFNFNFNHANNFPFKLLLFYYRLLSVCLQWNS